MRLTVLQQTAKGLLDQTRDEEDYPLRDSAVRDLERLKWYLWHGNVFNSLQIVQSVEMDPDAAVATSGHATACKLLKAVEEFHTSIENNQGFIPNYGERYRHGERISTGFVESTVNQVISKRFCKKQQMAWTPCGAHFLLQIRTRVLKWRWGSHIPAVVSGVPCCSPGNGGVTPQNQTLSISSNGPAVEAPAVLLEEGIESSPCEELLADVAGRAMVHVNTFFFLLHQA
jgi:hypothetical protein